MVQHTAIFAAAHGNKYETVSVPYRGKPEQFRPYLWRQLALRSFHKGFCLEETPYADISVEFVRLDIDQATQPTTGN